MLRLRQQVALAGRRRWPCPSCPSCAARRSSSAAADGDGGSSDNPYEGFEPGREWKPLDPGRLAKGDERRARHQALRRRWERHKLLEPATVATVCAGNIARSQVLAHFLDERARAVRIPLRVISAGVAEELAYPGWRPLVAETERRLAEATPPGLPRPQLRRDWWSDDVAARLQASSVVLAADSDVRDELVRRLGAAADAPPVLLFYEFCGEGAGDFRDTFDDDTGAQDAERYDRCFGELDRLATKAVGRLDRLLEALGAGEGEGLPRDGVALSLATMVDEARSEGAGGEAA